MRLHEWGTRSIPVWVTRPNKQLLPPTSSTRGAHTSIRGIAPASRDRTECMTHTDTGKLRSSRDSICNRTSSGGLTRERLESGRA
jgi:hypothetical protein